MYQVRTNTHETRRTPSAFPLPDPGHTFSATSFPEHGLTAFSPRGISPSDSNENETSNTLKYANRAKNIKNKPVKNYDPNLAKMQKMRDRIVELETALALAVIP